MYYKVPSWYEPYFAGFAGFAGFGVSFVLLIEIVLLNIQTPKSRLIFFMTISDTLRLAIHLYSPVL